MIHPQRYWMMTKESKQYSILLQNVDSKTTTCIKRSWFNKTDLICKFKCMQIGSISLFNISMDKRKFIYGSSYNMPFFSLCMNHAIFMYPSFFPEHKDYSSESEEAYIAFHATLYHWKYIHLFHSIDQVSYSYHTMMMLKHSYTSFHGIPLLLFMFVYFIVTWFY
jgi:hypothetical protein